MHRLDLLMNDLPHFYILLQLGEVILANNTLDEVVSHLSSAHVEVWNHDLADEDGLVCLKLVDCFQLLFT
jgi:hypothetical protein